MSTCAKKTLGYCASDAEGYLRELTCRKERPDPLILDAIRDAIDGHAVFLFVKPGCGFCEKAKALLKDVYPQAKALSREGSTRPYRIGLAHALGVAPGNVSFPAVWIRGVFVGGADDLFKLHAARTLEEKLLAPHTPMAPMGAGLVKTRPKFCTQLAGSHAHLQTDGPCQASTSKWFCFQTKSYAQVIRTMSVFHVAVLAVMLVCLEAGTDVGASVAAVWTVVLFVDLVLFILLGATPLTLFGNLSTWLVWNVKGESIPALPYKFVWFVYVLALGRAAVLCSGNDAYDGSVALCWQNNTEEFRVGLTSGIVNSGFLAVFRF
jgi:glutaredoxin